MNNVAQLIAQVEFLIQLISGTEAGESQTVIEINDLIGKVKKELEQFNSYQFSPETGESFYDFIKRHELKNPKNPE